MASSNDNVSMALFCDFENVALGVRDANYDKFDIKPVLERLLLKGSIVVKKAYCDWDRYKGFKAPMHEANFELIEIPHVRQSGKNSADIRMVVDALDLCYTKSHVDTFVIISGDSDFSPLVSKLRENAKKVIGVGVKQSTSDLLVANCDEFIFYDDLVRESRRARRDSAESKPAVKRSPEEERSRREEMEKRRDQAVEIAVNTFEALVSERGDSGKIWASVLKEAIKRRKPDFSESYYGFRTFGNLIEECKARGLLEFGRDEKSGAYVYRGNGASSGAQGAGDNVSASMDAGLPVEEGKQESRRNRGRGRTAAERFAERQAERLAQQARAARSDEDGEDADEAELGADAEPVTQAEPVLDTAAPEAVVTAGFEAELAAEPPVVEAERGRGRNRGNRGGRKQGERQATAAAPAAAADAAVDAVTEAAAETVVDTVSDTPVILEAAVDLPAGSVVPQPDAQAADGVDVVTPAKKKSGPKPPARKVKAAAKPKTEEAVPAKPGRNSRGGKGASAAQAGGDAAAAAAASTSPASPVLAVEAVPAASPSLVDMAPDVSPAPADSAPAASVWPGATRAPASADSVAGNIPNDGASSTNDQPAKPAKAKAAAKPARKPATRGARPPKAAKAAGTDE